jgi:hypothetical protein
MNASLYRQWRGAELLYIGITSVGMGRQRGHAASSSWWAEVTSVTVEHYDTIDAARDAERRAIKAEAPLYNLADAPPEQRRRAERLRRHERAVTANPLDPEGVLTRIAKAAPPLTGKRRELVRALLDRSTDWPTIHRLRDELSLTARH